MTAEPMVLVTCDFLSLLLDDFEPITEEQVAQAAQLKEAIRLARRAK